MIKLERLPRHRFGKGSRLPKRRWYVNIQYLLSSLTSSSTIYRNPEPNSRIRFPPDQTARKSDQCHNGTSRDPGRTPSLSTSEILKQQRWARTIPTTCCRSLLIRPRYKSRLRFCGPTILLSLPIKHPYYVCSFLLVATLVQTFPHSAIRKPPALMNPPKDERAPAAWPPSSSMRP